MVFVTGLRQNTNHIFAGIDDASWAGIVPFTLSMVVVGWAWAVASPFTIRHARLVQHTGKFMIGWLKGLVEWWDPKHQLSEADISPHFWPNGTMPHSAEFDALVADRFAHYRLRVGGLVKRAQEFSLAELQAMPKQEQITEHFLHPRLVRGGEVGRRADAPHPRPRPADRGDRGCADDKREQ